MRLKNVSISNFKCFKDLKFDLHPHMNVLIGINGTGKTSLLEAMRILVGSLFLGLDKYDDKLSIPGIVNDDIRLDNMEPQLPTTVQAAALMDDFNGSSEQDITWKRSVETLGGKTLYRDASQMMASSRQMQQGVRDNQDKDIPLIAYFSTDRYKKERRDTKVEPTGSRLRGYFNALNVTTNSKFFLDLYYTETLDEVQNERQSTWLTAVNDAVKKCVNCKELKYMLKENMLTIVNDDNVRMPYSLLSDGVRCTLSMVMEIAFRCCLLNPHLGKDAPLLTKGVVLIDEIDLHLHPSWQLHILNDLRQAFPLLQFVVTTHAPLVISQVSDCAIYSIADRQVYEFPVQNGRDANYILEQMNVKYMSDESRNLLNEYFVMIENGQGCDARATHLRQQLEAILGENHAELQRADMMKSFF